MHLHKERDGIDLQEVSSEYELMKEDYRHRDSSSQEQRDMDTMQSIELVVLLSGYTLLSKDKKTD